MRTRMGRSIAPIIAPNRRSRHPKRGSEGRSRRLAGRAGALIGRLLERSRPFAVFGAVIAVHVDAVQGLALGALAHVGQKVRKAVPSLAIGDPTAAVVSEPCGRRRAAALHHRSPRVVRSGLLAVGVFGQGSGGLFSSYLHPNTGEDLAWSVDRGRACSTAVPPVIGTKPPPQDITDSARSLHAHGSR